MQSLEIFKCKRCNNTGKYFVLNQPDDLESIALFCGCKVGLKLLADFEKSVFNDLT
jgi:hypothetical protein